MSGITPVAFAGAAAPEEPQYRAPARRISAAGAAADRTAQAFEGAMSEFKAMFEIMREENAALRRDVSDLRAHAVVENAATSAALKAQADTITALRAELTTKASRDEVSEAIKPVSDKLDKTANILDHHHHEHFGHTTSNLRLGMY
ncbi:MAG: hypothetical protein NTX49_10200 [Chlamydiae bacterium]|nr:hypothetical protein [Chlamydiota bacterium]